MYVKAAVNPYLACHGSQKLPVTHKQEELNANLSLLLLLSHIPLEKHETCTESCPMFLLAAVVFCYLLSHTCMAASASYPPLLHIRTDLSSFISHDPICNSVQYNLDSPHTQFIVTFVYFLFLPIKFCSLTSHVKCYDT